MMFFKQFYQIGGSTGLKPITTKFIIFKSIEQTERIIHTDRVMRKMITIVILLQFCANFIIRHSLSTGQTMKLILQIVMQFLLINATDIYILIPHRNIIQIIQIAEYTDLTEFGYSRQHTKLDAPILTLQCSVKSLQCLTIAFLKLVITYGLQHRFIIFVYKHHHPLSGLITSTLNDTLKTGSKCSFIILCAIESFPSTQSTFQHLIECFGSSIFLRIQIQMQYGVFYPILFQFFHSQSVKEFFLSLKIGFERRKQKTFAKTARATKEVITTSLHQLIYQCRFINVEISVFTNFLKILYSDRIYFIFHTLHSFKIAIHKDTLFD